MKAPATSLLLTAVQSLSLGEDRRYLLQTIPPDRWPRLLELADDSRLTLPLAVRAADYTPDAVRRRLAGNLASNAIRQSRMRETYREIEAALKSEGIEFLVLKGVAQYSPWQQKADWRPQYDIDLYCPNESLCAAADALGALGFEAVHSTAAGETDHLPPFVRKSQFLWCGDYYDPDLPFSIEIHHRFWNPARNFFTVGSSELWSHRAMISTYCGIIPALDPADAVSYATWHLTKHLVRGNLKIFHVYELACFLKASKDDDSFWSQWDRTNHSPGRVAEGVAFQLASAWFHCPMHPVAAHTAACLPSAARRWFDLFAMSPVTAAEYPNKDELFLHIGLASRWIDRAKILRQRIAPMNPPNVGSGGARTRFLTRRAAYHISALFPVMRSASRWYRTAAVRN